MSWENNVVSFPDGKAKKAAAKNRGKSHSSHIERLIGLRNEHQKKVDQYQKRVEIWTSRSSFCGGKSHGYR
jgi:hypothetical protein